MDNFIVSVNAVLPTFLLIAIGYFLKQIGVVNQDFLKQLNRLTFIIFLPVMLFQNIYTTDISQTLNFSVIGLALGCLLILVLLLCIIIPRMVHDNKQKGVIIQAIFRSNYLIFGVSIVTNMFGEEKAAVAAMLGAVLVPTYNFLAVIILEIFTNEGKIDGKHTVLSILKNPLIIAGVLGILAAATGLQFPQFIDTTLSQIGRVATPLALIVLGGEFDFASLKGRFLVALIVSLIKLIAVPAIMIPIAIGMGLRGENLVALMIAGASPVAVSSYIMAQQAKADYKLAGQIIVLSSFLCLFTIFGWVYLLKYLNFI